MESLLFPKILWIPFLLNSARIWWNHQGGYWLCPEQGSAQADHLPAENNWKETFWQLQTDHLQTSLTLGKQDQFTIRFWTPLCQNFRNVLLEPPLAPLPCSSSRVQFTLYSGCCCQLSVTKPPTPQPKGAPGERLLPSTSPAPGAYKCCLPSPRKVFWLVSRLSR